MKITVPSLVRDIANLSFPNTFNPYHDHCSEFDRPHAPSERRKLLESVLRRATSRVSISLWVGRDLGHRGGRRTGLPFVSDVNQSNYLRRWGLEPAPLTTKNSSVNEVSSDAIFNTLSRLNKDVFLWNVFPLHPHYPRQPFTNRAHNAKERDAGLLILSQLIKLLCCETIVAIGAAADLALRELVPERTIHAVRHPAHGGNKQFTDQIKQLYGLT